MSFPGEVMKFPSNLSQWMTAAVAPDRFLLSSWSWHMWKMQLCEALAVLPAGKISAPGWRNLHFLTCSYFSYVLEETAMYNKVHFPLYLKTKPTNNRHKVASGQGFLQNICSAAHPGSVPCETRL